jgi:arylsulfatase A-like enzyme
MRKIRTTLVGAALALLGLFTAMAPAADQANIVYIALEDITPMMGCYGDTYAKTPVFDKLATEGIRYTHAYSVGPVCSVSRSSIVTGMYPTTLGTMHHRSNVGKPPAFLEMIPNQMRKVGYFTTNNAKTDYNIGGAKWHQSNHKAHWRNRPDKNQAFFAKFDFHECHSSITKTAENVIVKQRLNRLKPEDFHDPAKAPIPPFHPDVPMFRKAWSRYYDAVTQVDYRAGEIIAQLKEDGLWDDTIVIVWADHGVGMPRGKHTVFEQGTHVPLIVRYPKKYQHLAPAKPGSVLDDMICLMDMGPSVMKLAGIETPDYMHGRALLCKSDAKKRDYVVANRDRLDSRFEMVRAIRDKRYRYQRNFYPNLPYKPYEDYEFGAPVLIEWVKLARAGKLTGAMEMPAMRFKPIEELYDSKSDPHMVKNLAADPSYVKVLKLMRQRLDEWMIETIDLGIMAEAEVHKRAEGKSAHWDVGQELKNYPQILEAANLQLKGQAAVPELKALCKDADPAIRFWAVSGLAVVTQTAGPEVVSGIVPSLKSALKDDSVSVRLSAAEGLCNLGHWHDAAPVLSKALTDPMISARIRASGILDTQPPEASQALLPAIANLKIAAAKTNVKRMRGIPYGLNAPFARAYRAITGQANYYRWGIGASGSPKSSLMKVQQSPFVPKEGQPLRRR